MAAVFGGYGLLRIQHEERALLGDEEARMAVTSKALQAAVENALRDRQISDIKRLLAELELLHEQIDRIRIFDLALRPLLVSNPLAIGEDIPVEGLSQAMEERQPILFYRRERGERALYSLVPLRDRAGIVHGAMEIVRLAGYIDARLADARWDVAQRVGLLTAILAVLLWIGVRQTVLLPIRRLMAGVHALAEGQPRPIPARGRDEFARLARSFNEMAARLADAHARLVAETEARLDLARQVRQAEQLAVAGRIAAEVAHEIGTPLNVVSGRAEFLLQTLEPGDPRAVHLQTIIAQSERITGILAALLDVVRPRKAEPQAEAIGPLLAGVVQLLEPTARAKGLTLATDLQPESRVLADPNQLQQVVINLLVNAIEATPAGGRVLLRAAPAPGPDGRPGVTVEVDDSGSGIRAEDLGRVFDPFFTTKPPGQGTGLGLAICRDIVREHGGTIHLDSAVGRGTTVRVWLPAPEGTAA